MLRQGKFVFEFGIVSGGGGIGVACGKFDFSGGKERRLFRVVDFSQFGFIEGAVEEADMIDEHIAAYVAEGGLFREPFRTDPDAVVGIGKSPAVSDIPAVEFAVEVDFRFAVLESDLETVPAVCFRNRLGNTPRRIAIVHVARNRSIDIKTVPAAAVLRVLVEESGIDPLAMDKKIDAAIVISAHQQWIVPGTSATQKPQGKSEFTGEVRQFSFEIDVGGRRNPQSPVFDHKGELFRYAPECARTELFFPVSA